MKRKCTCILCKNLVTVNQLNIHYGSKQCSNGKVGHTKLELIGSLQCEFCGKSCTSTNSFRNHVRRCPKNPQRTYKNGMLGKSGSSYPRKNYVPWNAGISKDELKKRYSPESWAASFGSGRVKHSEETKQKLSKIACERIQKHSKYSKNTEYKPGVILESSYEVDLAKILDKLDIEWIKVRKGYVWDDNGKCRRYIPDFYLPKYDIFLDPKNDYLIKKDARKIASAMELNNIKVIVLSKEQITEDFILVSTGCRRDL